MFSYSDAEPEMCVPVCICAMHAYACFLALSTEQAQEHGDSRSNEHPKHLASRF